MSPASTTVPSHHSDFIFIGENPAIDFANTLAAPQGTVEDLLPSWGCVVDWLDQAKLTKNPGLNLPATAGTKALAQVVALRTAWRTEMEQLVEGGKVSDGFLERLNGLLAPRVFHETLLRNGKKGFQLIRSIHALPGKDMALAILACEIADFLALANLDYLRRCANRTSCVLFFYDTTKNHRRQWCSAAACGNRHKVAEFRRRQAKAK